MREPQHGYYRACIGLDRTRGFLHLFRENVIVLACRKRFYFSDDNPKSAQLLGYGWRFLPPPPEKLRKILAKAPFPRNIPVSLRHFVDWDHFSRRARGKTSGRCISLRKAITLFQNGYRLTNEIIVCLSAAYKMPVGTVVQLMGNNRGLSTWELQALQAETILRLAKQVKALRFILNRVKWLDAMRVDFEAVCLVWQSIRSKSNHSVFPPSSAFRCLGRAKASIVADPFAYARFLKELSHECRAYYFGGPKPRNHLVSWLSDEDCLCFSYIARSLPPPLGDTPDELDLKYQSFLERLNTDIPEDPEWRPWVVDYLERFKPPEINYSAEPSNSASIGYPRGAGGHPQAYQDLVLFGLFLRLSTYKEGDDLNKHLSAPPEDTRPRYFYARSFLSSEQGPRVTFNFQEDADDFGSQIEGVSEFDETNLQSGIRSANSVSRFMNELMIEACEWLLKNVITHVPILPIFADEKGMKTRLPTATITPVTIFLQPLRKAADQFLLRDYRTSESLGGSRACNLAGEPGPWLSLDLTVATDMHPFWMTKTFYHEMVTRHVPSLSWFLAYEDQLLGPMKVLHYNARQQIGEPPRLTRGPTEISFGTLMGALLSFVVIPRATTVGGIINRGEAISILTHWADDYLSWYQRLEALPGTITKGGQMMGNATSWALLPLVNIYSLEKAGLRRLDTCGDDALIPRFKPQYETEFRRRQESLGAIRSDKKTFRHPTRGIFKEIPYVNGVRQPYDLMSFWVAPYGGTKGEMHWYNMPSAFRGFCRTQGRSEDRASLRRAGLWNYSKFYYEWSLACKLGIPVGAPDILGGIGLPIMRTTPRFNRDLWSAYLATLPKREVLKRGLSLVPNSGPLIDAASEKWVDDRLQEIVCDYKTPYRIPYKDYAAALQNPFSVTAIFTRSIREIRGVPNVSHLASKLHRRIEPMRSKKYPSKVTKFSAEGLERDFNNKRDAYVNDSIPDNVRQRNFSVSSAHAEPYGETPPFQTKGLGW